MENKTVTLRKGTFSDDTTQQLFAKLKQEELASSKELARTVQAKKSIR